MVQQVREACSSGQVVASVDDSFSLATLFVFFEVERRVLTNRHVVALAAKITPESCEQVVRSPDGVAWGEQEVLGLAQIVVNLVDLGQVVENPERTTMGGDHHVGVLDDQVIHRAHRQVGLQRLPLGAVVERAVQAEFSTCVQQSQPDSGLHVRPGRSHLWADQW